jgi:hypothetical protein
MVKQVGHIGKAPVGVLQEALSLLDACIYRLPLGPRLAFCISFRIRRSDDRDPPDRGYPMCNGL